jgi:hypothetical protein
MTMFVVVYKTATHVAFKIFKKEAEARESEYYSGRWNGSLYSIEDADGFGAAEAKDLYNHGADAMAPGWGVREVAE